MHSPNVEIQNIMCMLQNMAEAVQAMQNMMMSNASANLVAPGSAIKRGQRSKVERSLQLNCRCW